MSNILGPILASNFATFLLKRSNLRLRARIWCALVWYHPRNTISFICVTWWLSVLRFQHLSYFLGKFIFSLILQIPLNKMFGYSTDLRSMTQVNISTMDIAFLFVRSCDLTSFTFFKRREKVNSLWNTKSILQFLKMCRWNWWMTTRLQRQLNNDGSAYKKENFTLYTLFFLNLQLLQWTIIQLACGWNPCLMLKQNILAAGIICRMIYPRFLWYWRDLNHSFLGRWVPLYSFY